MANLYEKMVLPRLEDIRKWAENGVTEEDIAKNCGVSYASFRNYKKPTWSLKELYLQEEL